jgi:hypothetical protein
MATLPKPQRPVLAVVVDNCTAHIDKLSKYATDAAGQSSTRIGESTSKIVPDTKILVTNAYGAIGKKPPLL